MNFKRTIQRELLKVIEKIIETNEKIEENQEKLNLLLSNITVQSK